MMILQRGSKHGVCVERLRGEILSTGGMLRDFSLIGSCVCREYSRKHRLKPSCIMIIIIIITNVIIIIVITIITCARDQTRGLSVLDKYSTIRLYH